MNQLKREDWLEQSLNLLAKHGVDALTIDKLCSHFGVTKGSFYHHFKNRQVFLEAILDFWEENYTNKFIEYSLEGANELEQLERLNQLVVAKFGTAEANIRAWAQSDPLARAYQERVDQRRMDFLYEVQAKLFSNAETARTLAKLQYAVLIGSAQILPALTANDLEAMFILLSRLLISEHEKD